MRFEAVTFDCAMTLLDVDWDPGRLVVQSAAEVGCALEPQTAMRDYNRALQERWPEYLLLNKQADVAACDAFWHDLLIVWCRKQDLTVHADEIEKRAWTRLYGPSGDIFRVFDDVLPTLEALRAIGLKLGVLSNWDYSLSRVLDSLGLGGRFDAVVASLVVGPEKPDPRLFQHTESVLGVPPESILHVGDSFADDYEGAIGSGWSALLLDRSEPSTEFHKVQSLLEVCERLDQL